MAADRGFQVRDSLSATQRDELMRLCASEWWTKARTRRQIDRMLASTDLVYAVVDQADSLVAFARVLTDRTYVALIFDVIVKSGMRGTSLGCLLLDHICSDPPLKDVGSIELHCRPEHASFYAKWGFTEKVGASRLMRRTVDAVLLDSSARVAGPSEPSQSSHERPTT